VPIDAAAVSSEPLDSEAIASRVRSVVAEALSRDQSPLHIVVKVAPEDVDIRVFPAARHVFPSARGWSFADWFRGRLHERSLTQEGVARVLGVSAKTVKSRLFSARRSFARALEVEQR